VSGAPTNGRPVVEAPAGGETRAFPLPLALAVEAALNALIARDPESRRRLAALDGKLVALRFSGLDAAAYFFCHADGVEVAGRHDGGVDASIEGAPFSLASMPFSRRALFTGRVRLGGDVELAKRFHRLLEQIDVDWEEELSQLLGDIAAHQLGKLARDASHWLRRAGDGLRQDLADYLQEEAGQLPPRAEIETFHDAIDELREDCDRLAARLALLPGDAGEDGSDGPRDPR